MKPNYYSCCLLFLIIFSFTSCSSVKDSVNEDIKNEYSVTYSDSIRSDQQKLNTILLLKDNLLQKEIELLKTRRTLGWVMTVPTLSWTTLITIVGLSNSRNMEMDTEDCLMWGSALATASISFYGLSLIFDSNDKLSEIEKYANPVSVGFIYKPSSNTFGLSFSLGL